MLILHSYHQGLEWTDNITRGIKEVFQPFELQFELYYEYLDTKRNAGEAYMESLYQLQKSKLRNNTFSLVLVCDNNALAFLVKHGVELFGNAPVVFCGINNFKREMLGNRTNITGVVERTDYVGELELIGKLHPERTHVTMILDRTPTGDAIFEDVKTVLSKFPDMTFSFYRDFLLTEVHENISKMGSRDVIYLLTFNRDKNDNFISYREGLEMIRKAAIVPIYGSWDFYLGKGIVGGILTRGIDQGRQAGRMALDILHGSPLSSIPIDYDGVTVPVFDYRELDRFNIVSSKSLPNNSVLINTPPTLSDLYSQYLLYISLFLLIVSSLLGFRMYFIRRRNHRLLEEKIILDVKVKQRTQELEKEKTKLEETLTQVKTLEGLLPICANCKKIRDEHGDWNQMECYIAKRTDAVFSHGVCPDCAQELYGGILDINIKNNKK